MILALNHRQPLSGSKGVGNNSPVVLSNASETSVISNEQNVRHIERQRSAEISINYIMA